MSQVNFKLSENIVLNGYTLSAETLDNGLYFNGDKLATEGYVTSAISGISIPPAYITSVSSPLAVDLIGNLTVDLNSYLTTSDASSTYATQSSLSSYLTTSDASSTYLSQSDASSTYQTQSGLDGAVSSLGYITSSGQYIQSTDSNFTVTSNELTLNSTISVSEIDVAGSGDFTVTGSANIVLNPASGSKAYIGSVSSNNEIVTMGNVPAGYTNTDVDNHLSGGNGINYSSGTISVHNGSGLTFNIANQLIVDTDTIATKDYVTGLGYVTETGTETLSNKTLSSPTITVGSAPVSLDATNITFWVATIGGGVKQANFEFDNASAEAIHTAYPSGGTALVTFTGATDLNGTWPLTLGTYYPAPGAQVVGTSTNAHWATISASTYPDANLATAYSGISASVGTLSTISSTEISYLDGVTSNIQTQLNSKLVSSDLTGYATETYVGSQGFITSSGQYIQSVGTHLSVDGSHVLNVDLSGYALTSDIPSLSGYATETYVGNAINDLVNGAPAALNTLKELADAINDDASYASTITTALGNKQDTLTAGNGITLTGSTISLNPDVIINSVSLTDVAEGIKAETVLFGNKVTSTYAKGSAQSLYTFTTGTVASDILLNIVDSAGNSRTSKLTAVFNGGAAPVWTEYGIVDSASTGALSATVSFSGNAMSVNVAGSGTYAVYGMASNMATA